jgi:hypothetical protein
MYNKAVTFTWYLSGTLSKNFLTKTNPIKLSTVEVQKIQRQKYHILLSFQTINLDYIREGLTWREE